MTPPPTPTRLQLARDIDAGEVNWYAWVDPEARWTSSDGSNTRKVTADVRFLIDTGVAERGKPGPAGYCTVALTADGKAWLAQHGGTP